MSTQIMLYNRLKELEEKAINRIRTYEPISTGIKDKPYYVCYSGGKDSDVLRILFTLAGVPFDLVHNHTTVDAPETVYYIKNIPDIRIEYPKTSMWKLIEGKGSPPTRLMRYCCSVLKEHGGENRFIATGVRWSESAKRKNREILELSSSNKKNRKILNNDNVEDRRLLENCYHKQKLILNPILDWTDEDVWEFLKYYNCESNPLYQCGYKRIGCIGCPMSSRQKKELEKYPKYKINYIKAFNRMINKRIERGLKVNDLWKDGESVYKWWIGEYRKKSIIDGQLQLLWGKNE